MGIICLESAQEGHLQNEDNPICTHLNSDHPLQSSNKISTSYFYSISIEQYLS